MRICVIGCGRIAKSHVEAAAQIPELEVVAAVGTTPGPTEKFAKEYGIPAAFSGLEEAADRVEFEAVDICLPNHLHKSAAVRCAQMGKHILVEKPMANTVEECQEMIKASDEAGVTLMVGQSRRFYNAVMESKSIADSGEIGRLVSVSANLYGYLDDAPTAWWKDKRKAGGLMIPIWGSHIIDYCLWMFGETPVRVFCEAGSVNEKWEGEDEVTILMGFAGGGFSTIRMSWNAKLKERAWDGTGKMLSSSDILYERYVQGTKGTLYLNDETELKRDGRPVALAEQVLSNFALQYREFISAIKDKREALTSGRRVIDVVRVGEAALKSAASHRVVEL